MMEPSEEVSVIRGSLCCCPPSRGIRLYDLVGLGGSGRLTVALVVVNAATAAAVDDDEEVLAGEDMGKNTLRGAGESPPPDAWISNGCSLHVDGVSMVGVSGTSDRLLSRGVVGNDFWAGERDLSVCGRP